MKCSLIQQTFNTGIQQVTDNHSTHTAHFHTESYLSTAQTTRHTATYIKQSIIKNTYFGEVRWDENARTNDAAARFKLTREYSVLPRWNTTVNWIQYQNWETYIRWSVPLVSATDWLNSQSADRLNIRSADWPVPRSNGDITQADQPTLQKPSAPSPLIQRTNSQRTPIQTIRQYSIHAQQLTQVSWDRQQQLQSAWTGGIVTIHHNICHACRTEVVSSQDSTLEYAAPLKCSKKPSDKHLLASVGSST